MLTAVLDVAVPDPAAIVVLAVVLVIPIIAVVITKRSAVFQ